MARQITGYARHLFDVVGFSRRLPNGESLLIVGLKSTTERNLDEFGRTGRVFQMYGFKKHVAPRLKLLLGFIQENGFAAREVGQYGYPQDGRISLKEEAIRAGLGARGKSTLVLHPKYGPRLRFAAIRTAVPLKLAVDLVPAERESPFCQACTICIDVCPVKILEPFRMSDISLCLSNSSVMAEEHGRLVLCDECLHRCPAGGER